MTPKVTLTPSAVAYLASRLQDLSLTLLKFRTETYTKPVTNHWLIIEYHEKLGEYEIINPIVIPHPVIPANITVDYDGEKLFCF